MKIKYGGNAKICEIDSFEYLQKLIYTEIMLKICNYIYTARFLTSGSIQHPKTNITNQLLKSKF